MDNKLVFEPTTLTQYNWRKYDILTTYTYYWRVYTAVADYLYTHYWTKNVPLPDDGYLWDVYTTKYKWDYKHYWDTYNTKQRQTTIYKKKKVRVKSNWYGFWEYAPVHIKHDIYYKVPAYCQIQYQVNLVEDIDCEPGEEGRYTSYYTYGAQHPSAFNKEVKYPNPYSQAANSDKCILGYHNIIFNFNKPNYLGDYVLNPYGDNINNWDNSLVYETTPAQENNGYKVVMKRLSVATGLEDSGWNYPLFPHTNGTPDTSDTSYNQLYPYGSPKALLPNISTSGFQDFINNNDNEDYVYYFTSGSDYVVLTPNSYFDWDTGYVYNTLHLKKVLKSDETGSICFGNFNDYQFTLSHNALPENCCYASSNFTGFNALPTNIKPDSLMDYTTSNPEYAVSMVQEKDNIYAVGYCNFAKVCYKKSRAGDYRQRPGEDTSFVGLSFYSLYDTPLSTGYYYDSEIGGFYFHSTNGGAVNVLTYFLKVGSDLYNYKITDNYNSIGSWTPNTNSDEFEETFSYILNAYTLRQYHATSSINLRGTTDYASSALTKLKQPVEAAYYCWAVETEYTYYEDELKKLDKVYITGNNEPTTSQIESIYPLDGYKWYDDNHSANNYYYYYFRFIETLPKDLWNQLLRQPSFDNEYYFKTDIILGTYEILTDEDDIIPNTQIYYTKRDGCYDDIYYYEFDNYSTTTVKGDTFLYQVSSFNRDKYPDNNLYKEDAADAVWCQYSHQNYEDTGQLEKWYICNEVVANSVNAFPADGLDDDLWYVYYGEVNTKFQYFYKRGNTEEIISYKGANDETLLNANFHLDRIYERPEGDVILNEIGTVSSHYITDYPENGMAIDGFYYIYQNYTSELTGYHCGTLQREVSGNNINLYPIEGRNETDGLWYELFNTITHYNKGTFISNVSSYIESAYPQNSYIINQAWYEYVGSTELITGELTIDASQLMGGVNYTQEINPSEDLMIGAGGAAQVDFTIYAPDAAAATQYLGKDFTYYVKMPHDNEWRQVGVFTLTKAELPDKQTAKIEGFDYIYKFDVVIDEWLDSLTFPMTLGNLFNSLCEYVGCEAYSTEFNNSNFVVNDNFEAVQITGRTILQYITEVSGGFCVAEPDGRIHIKQYSIPPTGTINLGNDSYVKYTHEIYNVPVITSVVVRKDDEDEGVESNV